MHRRMRAQGIDPERISVLTWLRYLGDRGMGALTFHPAEGGPANEALELSLKKVEGEAQKIFQGRASKVLPELELAGGSPGGARPKVVVGLGPGDAMVAGATEVPRGFEHWLIKFGPSGHHTTSIMGEALKPTRAHLLRLAQAAALSPSVAETTLRKVERAVAGFGATAKDVGVTAATRKKVQKRLDEVHRDYGG